MNAWRWCKLGQAFKTVTGNTPSKTDKASYGSFIPLVKPGELQGSEISSAEDGLSEKGMKLGRIAPKNSVLVSCIGNLGKIGINTIPVAFNQQINAIVQNKEIAVPKFMFYQALSLSFQDQLNKSASGTTITIVNKAKFNEIEIVLAPVSEQQRIVAILDEAFAGIDAAISNTEKNIENAAEMAASNLSLILMHEGDAREITLEEAVSADCSLSYGIVQPGDELLGGLPIVRPTDLGARTIALDGLKCIDPALASGYSRTTLQGGDLLLCVRGSTGVVSQAAEELAGANVTRGIVPIRFKPNVLKQDLGYFLLRSAEVQKAIRDKTYGAALMQINIRDVRKITLRVPRMDRQAALLAKMREAVSNGEALLDVYERKRAALTALKQSILHRAFAGDLTATPDRLLEAAVA